MTGVLIAAHGSLFHADSSTPARRLVSLLGALDRFDEVRVAFWREQPSCREALLGMASEDIVVVPLFISDGHYTRTIIPRELGLAGRVTARADRRLRYTEPIGTHPAMTHVILRRAQEAMERGRIPRKDSALVIAGHGTRRNPRSAEAVLAQVERLEQSSGFGEVCALFMDQEPNIETLYESVDAEQIVVVPYFIADGLHTREDIPRTIGLGTAVLTSGSVALGIQDGRRVLYTSAVGTDSTLVEVVLARVDDALSWDEPAEPAAADPWLDQITPGRVRRAREALIAELGRAAPLRFGELLIEDADDAGRYRLYHHRDSGLAGLRTLGSTDDLDALCHANEHGYRPLRYRDDLPGGWQLKPESAEALVDALEILYPSGVCLRFGNFEPVLLRDSVARHSGSLERLEGLGQAAARRAAHAACGGLGCLRNPRWLDEAIDTGAAAFACPEACALMNTFALRILDEEEQAPVAGEEAVAMLSEQARATVENALRAMRRQSAADVADFNDPANPAWITYLLARHYGWKDA